MRVLHFCNYADRVGGAEVYAHALVQALRERGHEVALFGASPGAEKDEPGLRVVRRPFYDPDHLVRDPRVVAALDEYLARFRPDVVHVHNLFSVALEVVQALGNRGVPLVHTVHDFQLLCPNSWCVRGDGAACPGGAGEQCFLYGCQQNYPYDAWSVLLASVRQHLAAHAASIALAPSAYLVERLRAHGWGEVRRLPYFIDFAPIEGSIRQHELLYVGRLEKEKGVGVILDALPEITRRFPRAHLTILGNGSQYNALEARARSLGVTASVSFASHVPREQLPAHYARAEACVLPSLWTENSPLVAYECLASGVPMIGSRRGGIPELIEPDCGFTFEPGSPSDLARAVNDLFRLPADAKGRLRQAARARASLHDRHSHVVAVEQAYQECASTSRSSGVARYSELVPVLAQVEAERARGSSASMMDRARGIARRLGLPKVLPD